MCCAGITHQTGIKKAFLQVAVNLLNLFIRDRRNILNGGIFNFLFEGMQQAIANNQYWQ